MIEMRILNFMKRSFVYKSIEKTQIFKYFWVFLDQKCARESAAPIQHKISTSSAPQQFGVGMNRLHQGRHMLGGCELANAMTQVEDVGWPRGVFVGVRFAKTV